MTVTLTNDSDGVNEYLYTNVSNANISLAGDNNDTLYFTNLGSATDAQWEEVIEGIHYTNTSLNPTEGNRTIEFVVNDGTSDSVAATSYVNVVKATNEVSTLEDTDYVFAANNFTSQTDFNNIIIVSNATAGTLYLDSNGNDVFDSGEEVNTTSNATISQTQIDSGALKFKPATDLFGDEYAVFGYKVEDSNSVVGNPLPITLNVAENKEDNILSMTVTLSNDSDGEYEYLNANLSHANISLAQDANDTLYFTNLGSATNDQWEEVVEGIRYTNTSLNPTEGNRTIVFVVNDGVSDSLAATSYVDVANINDAPSIDSVFADISIAEDSGTTNYELNVSDIDSTDLNITVDSNNTSILTVTPNWTNTLDQAAWIQTQDFNLTTVADANGVVRVTITVLDEDKNSTRSFDVNVTPVDDAPVLNPIANQTPLEDFADFNLTLSASDIDGNIIEYTVGSSEPTKVTVSIIDGKVVVTPINNAFGNIVVEVNATANGKTATQTFDLNITAVDDAPVFTAQQGSFGVDEDSPSYSVLLSASDIESNPFTYTALASNNKASLSLVDNNLTITPSANAYGDVRVDVNVTQDSNTSLSDTYNFIVTINPVNDAPTIDTTFANIAILEDSGISNYDLNVSDIDSTDLNITVDSNDTSILTVTPNWTNSLNQATWTQIQDFNLTTVSNANGVVRITMRVLDEDKNSTRSFDVNVTAVNDLPTSSDLNITMDEDTSKTFTLNDFNFTDVDTGDTLDSIYITTLASIGALQLDGVDVTLNQQISESNITSGDLVFTPVANEFGTPYTTFGFKVNDGDTNSTSAYTVTINVNDVAEPVTPTPPPATPTQEPEDSGQLLDSPADEVDTGLDLNGLEEGEETIVLTFTNEEGTESTLTIPKVEGKTINTVFSADAIEFTLDDGVASYNNNGTTEHSIVVDNKATIAVSYIPDSLVEFTADGGVQTSVESLGSDIVIVATPTGESQNSVTNPSGVQTKADSTIPGTQTVIKDDGDVIVDTPEVTSSLGNEITTTTTLDSDGKVVVTAQRVKPDGTVEDVPLGDYGEGSEVKVEFVNGAVVVQIVTELGTETFTIRSRKK